MQILHDTKLKWKLSPEQKHEIVQLYLGARIEGKYEGTEPPTVSVICKLYHIDHSTVYYHLKRAQVFQAGKPREFRTFQQVIMPVERSIPRKVRILIPTDLNGDVINQGHDYKDYLRIQKERKFMRFGLQRK